MLCFNIEGFQRNRAYLKDLLNSACPKVVFLQEIWLPYHDQCLLDNFLPDFSFKIATPDMFQHNEEKLMNSGPTWHGAAIGWHQELNHKISFPETNHERFIGIKLKLTSGDCSLLLISLYAPTSGHDDDFLESVALLTEYICEHTAQGNQIVIGTDSNCSRKSTARRQDSWTSFCRLFSLKIHRTDLPTFHHNNGTSESSIDCFAASSTLDLENLRQFCTLETPRNLSSHDPIMSAITVRDVSEKVESKFSNTYNNFNRENIIWDESKMSEYQELSAKALTDALGYWDSLETIPHLCSLIPKLLVQCATSVFDRKSSKKSKPLGLSRRVIQAEKSFNNACISLH